MAKKSGNPYAPDRGDIIWIDFNPTRGAEIQKKRPALTLSPRSYNEKVGLGIFCPITTQQKGYPFEVLIPKNKFVEGVILSDQINSLDWRLRDTEFITRVPEEILEKIINKLIKLIISPSN